MAEKPRIYIDACCFIDIAKQQIGTTLSDDRAKNVWFLWKLMEAHKEKDVTLFTSTLTIAECTHADGVMDKRVQDLFTRLLTSGQYLTLVQPTIFLAADGRDLRWKHGITLKGADYLHVASALTVKCGELLTTDDRVLGHAAKIKGLGVAVIAPSATKLLPDKYRQGTMLDERVTPIRRQKPGAA